MTNESMAECRHTLRPGEPPIAVPDANLINSILPIALKVPKRLDRQNLRLHGCHGVHKTLGNVGEDRIGVGFFLQSLLQESGDVLGWPIWRAKCSAHPYPAIS